MERLARGELEAQVMDALWDFDGWLTPRGVHERVTTPRRQLAYNTVMTIMVRLWQKEMLERRPAGRAFEYRPVVPRDQWTAERMQELLQASSDRLLTLHRFVDGMSTRDATELRKVLAARKKRR